MSENTLGIAPLALAQGDESPTVDDTDDASTPSPDAIFEALSDKRRRYALYHLREVDEAVDLTALAEAVAITEATQTGTLHTEELRRRIRTTLYHRHLPLLSDFGLVEFDEDEKVVSFEAENDQLGSYLDRAMEDELSTSHGRDE